MAQCKKCQRIRVALLIIALLMIVAVNNMESLAPMLEAS